MGFICKLPHPRRRHNVAVSVPFTRLLGSSRTMFSQVSASAKRSLKCFLSFTARKENQPLAMHLILNKHFLLYRALLEPHDPQPPVTDSPDHSHHSLPNLRCLVYILSAMTLLNQGFLKKHFFTFINI